MRGTDEQVVVIGAGLAGLACARELNKHGIDTLVLEARNRIGGRVFGVTLPDGTAIELGAQLIGPRQLRVNRLAKEAGAQIVNLNHKGRSIREPSSSLSVLDRLRIAKLAWRIQKEVKRTPAQTPWLHPKAAQLDNISAAQWLNTMGSGKAASTWLSVTNRSLCLDASHYSALEALHHMSSMGGFMGLMTADVSMLEEGTSTLVRFLSAEQNIQLDTEVEHIEVVQDRVHIKTKENVIQAKQVVLAVPPQIGIKLLDSSPTSQMLGYPKKPLLANVTKTALVYPTLWWKNNGFSGTGTSDTGPVNELYNATPANSKHGVLMAISSGQCAQSLSKDEKERTNKIVEHVDRILKGNGQTPSFVDSVDWTSEPFSLGGYSSLRPFNSWMHYANKPIHTQGPIHIAGTESATQWRSYMEGALQSAEFAAANVLLRTHSQT